MTIYQIKAEYESTRPAHSYFGRAEMRFFNQTLKDFHVKRIDATHYHIWAPSYWQGRLMGYSQRIFNTVTKGLEDVPESIKK